MTKKKTNHYIDNKKFYTEMVKYYQMCEDAKFEKQKRPGVTNYIGECIFLIATQLATRPNFNGNDF